MMESRKEIEDESECGGYDIQSATLYSVTGGKMKEGDVKALQCPKCTYVLRDPVQLITCGCRFCTRCMDWLIANREREELKCPVDSTPFTEKHVRKDKGCVKEINLIQMDCPMSCGWHGLLVQSEDHLRESCPKALTPCSFGCGKSLPRLELADHVQVCPKQPLDCSYCGETVTKDGLKHHIKNTCPNSPMACDFCQEQLQSRSQFQNHLEESCTQYVMNCPVRSMLPCDYKGKRVDMTSHLQQHMIFMFEKVAVVFNKVETLEAENEQLKTALVKTEKDLKEKDEELTRLDKRVALLEKDVRHGGNKIHHDYHELADGIETDGRLTREIVQVRSKGGGEVAAARGIPRNVASDGVNMRQLATVVESSESNKTQIRQLSQSVQMMQENMTQQTLAVDEMRLRQDILDVRTTNGVFIWKIPDIRRRYREAIDRRTVSIYSPPFFTSPQGYRMCTRVYLNGDGIGKGTHVSVFFVLMKSEHDSLLQWPFKQSVRFTLINQANQNASITEAFAPDLHSPSFQQPENEMNIASGFPKFCKQSVLQDENFTKGNTIYIKAQVDLSGLAVY